MYSLVSANMQLACGFLHFQKDLGRLTAISLSSFGVSSRAAYSKFFIYVFETNSFFHEPRDISDRILAFGCRMFHTRVCASWGCEFVLYCSVIASTWVTTFT